MRRSLTPVIIRDGVHEHPAVRAWRSLHPDATPPDLIKMLKRPKRGRGEGRGGVYLLHGLGPNGSHLVAKDCLAEDAAGERASYEEVLPGLSVPCLRYHGWHPHRDGCGGWLFAQEASGAKFDKRDRGHRSLAAKWLGVLHAETLGRQAETNLPTRTS
ncbi:MAG: hypothetical protein HKN91_11180, partial [Acidimicrobiia bacterium]|nr:hypothetical protein [Acidimicrobiia bacterium]